MPVANSPEVEEKIARLVTLLEHQELGGVLLNAQHNFSWISGGASNAIDTSRENGAGSIFVTNAGDLFLVANNIEAQRLMDEELTHLAIEPVTFAWQAEKAAPDTALARARELTRGSVATDIPIHSSASPIEGMIARLRYGLTVYEIDRYRELGRDVAHEFDGLVDEIEPGNSESDVAAKLCSRLATKNIESVVTLVAADERINMYRHPVPTKKRVNTRVLVVTCSKRQGLIVSMSRIISFGPVEEDLARKTLAAAEVNASFLHATRPAASASGLYETAKREYERQGYGDEINAHHQGGAAGYKTREWVAHPMNAEIVQDRQAFAWNPSISGTKVEDTAILHNGAIEMLTRTERFPLIELDRDGLRYISHGILSL